MAETMKCPMCKEADMEDVSIGDVYNGKGTEIHICPDCPCVVFEYCDHQNWIDVGMALKLTRIK